MKQDAAELETQIEYQNAEISRLEASHTSEAQLMKSEHEQVLSELKDQLKESVLECSSLRMRLQTAE